MRRRAGDARRLRGTRPVLPEGGQRRLRRHPLRPRPRLRPGEHRLSGTATVTARATEDLSAFNLDLKGLRVERVTVEGRAARFNHTGQELTVRPPVDLDKGERFRAAVRYSGSPVTITDPDGSQEGWLRTADGALALGQPTGSMAWFPGNHHPSDKATYDLTVTVPEGLAAVSNGKPAGERTAGGRTTYRWRTAEPMASYLATVAIGDWDVRRSSGPRGLPVLTAVDPQQVKASRPVLAKIPEVIAWGEERFGPYPFSSAGAIVDRPQDIGYALETQTRPVFPGAPDTVLLVHELAHQWFGTPSHRRPGGTCGSTRASPRTRSGCGRRTTAATARRRSSTRCTRAATSRGGGERGGLGVPARRSARRRAHLRRPVYQRGAMVLHKIRQKTGDAAFRDLLKGWAAAHRHGNADTGDFTAYVERRAPDEDFSDVWDDWLYGEGRPDRP